MANFFGLCKRDTRLALWPGLEEYRVENILVAVDVVELLGRGFYQHLSSLFVKLIQIFTLREQSLYIFLFLSHKSC